MHGQQYVIIGTSLWVTSDENFEDFLNAIKDGEVNEETFDPDRWQMKMVQNHRPYDVAYFTKRVATLILERLDFRKPTQQRPKDGDVEQQTKEEIKNGTGDSGHAVRNLGGGSDAVPDPPWVRGEPSPPD